MREVVVNIFGDQIAYGSGWGLSHLLLRLIACLPRLLFPPSTGTIQLL